MRKRRVRGKLQKIVKGYRDREKGKKRRNEEVDEGSVQTVVKDLSCIFLGTP